MALTDFYPGTTKTFSVAITHNGAAPDITGDTVTLRIKKRASDSDEAAKLEKTADVATSGADGIALFVIEPADTDNISPGAYVYDIVWVLSGGAEYVLETGRVQLFNRVSDAA